LKVIKADGSIEPYLHTKVLGTISKALNFCEQDDISVMESLTEVVTYYLYQQKDKPLISSGEIFSLIKITLDSTGYSSAAAELDEYHYKRKLQRSRLEVVLANIQKLVDIEMANAKAAWNKSVIVGDLIDKYQIDRLTARTIASMVEENVMKMTISQIPTSLIKQLVLHDTALVLRAYKQLNDIPLQPADNEANC